MRARSPCLLAWLAAFGLACGSLAVSPAEAQREAPQLEAGREALAEADFQRALRAFDRAERTESLDRDQRIALHEGHALARFALGARARAQRDLRILAALDPTHHFPVEAPPELAEALAEAVREVGGGLGVELTWTDDARGSTLEVTVLRDPESIVAGVRVHTRVGAGAWRSTDGRAVRVPHAPGVAVAAWVELLGERDVVLAREARAEEPRFHGAPARVDASVAGEGASGASDAAHSSASSGGGDDALALGLGLGLGGAVIVAVAVVLGVVLGTQTSSDTQPSAPVVVGF